MKDLMWTASDDDNLPTNRFKQYVEDKFCTKFAGYDDLQRWSCQNLAQFWKSVWDFCDIRASVHGTGPVLDESRGFDKIPKWFTGTRLNYAENLLCKGKDNDAAVYFAREDYAVPKDLKKLTFAELNEKVRQYRAALGVVGVQKGDRVVALMPNCIECLLAMLGTASLGAVFSAMSPDLGQHGVVERFGQIEPKVLFCVDGVKSYGKVYDIMHKLRDIVKDLPTLEAVVLVPFVEMDEYKLDKIDIRHCMFESEFLNAGKLTNGSYPPLAFEQVSFDHPLFIAFTSGTTGLPKCMATSVGGTLLKHLEEFVIQECVGTGDVYFYRTTVSWSVWNFLMSVLATGAAIVLFDGSPFQKHMSILFDIIDATQITHFGMAASLYGVFEEQGYIPKNSHGLDSIKVFISTGSQLRKSTYEYIEQNFKPNVLIASIIGTTDINGSISGVCFIKTFYKGQGLPPCLGMDIAAWDDEGHEVKDQQGELVILKPFPSMPTHFLNDPDGSRYHDAYFSKFPGVWAVNDICVIDGMTGGITVHGRSDATLKPGGFRIGTADIYNVVESLPEVEDSICVGYHRANREYIVLFLKIKLGFECDKLLVKKVKSSIRLKLSHLHVPNFVLPVAEIPYTVSGKKVEVSVRRMLAGEDVKNRSSLRNPQALEYYTNIKELSQEKK